MLVSIESLISEKSYGSVCGARAAEGTASRLRIRVPLSASQEKVKVGEVWDVDGVVRETEWGPQMEVARARRALPNGSRLIAKYISTNVPGIGETRASRLCNHFGDRLAAALSCEDSIPEIATLIEPGKPLLAARIATAIVFAWQAMSAEVALISWLSGVGFNDLGVSRRISRILGDSAVDRLRGNPYILVSLVPWAKTDALGRAILGQTGCADPASDRRRLVGVVDAAARAALSEGHTVVDRMWLENKVANLLRRRQASDIVCDAMEHGLRNGAILRSDSGYRIPGAALMEDETTKHLLRLFQAPQPLDLKVQSKEQVERAIDVAIDKARSLHVEQRAAVIKVLTLPMACLQGGAGVGKTHTAQAICDVFEHAGGKVVLTALAGKAALRLATLTKRNAVTLARLLGDLQAREKIEAELRNLEPGSGERQELMGLLDGLLDVRPGTLVVIDEASMVDLATFYALVRRMPDGSRLLMIGDEAQLPPIGFGLVYHRLVSDDQIAARLTVVHRQTDASGIPVVSAAIRNRSDPLLAPYAGHRSGVTIVQCDLDSMTQMVGRLFAEISEGPGDTLVVGPTYEGVAGVRAINRMLHDQHRDPLRGDEIRGHHQQLFSPGEPVIWLRNVYQRSLVNGLMGRVRVTDVEERRMEVLFDGHTDPIWVEGGDFLDIALAYAVTCHKAQGSQAKKVIVPIYRSVVMDVSWIYTAVTRAQEQVIFVGDAAVLKDALRARSGSERRQVALRWVAPSH